jgi:hypothetical protein
VRCASVVAAIAASIALAACGGSSKRTSSAKPTSSSAGTSSTTSLHGPTRATVPISVVNTPGGRFLVVKVAVGGGRPVPVLVDTGSSGLALTRSAVGPKATFQGKGGGRYAGGSFTGTSATAPVTIQGTPNVTTTKPVGFLAVTSLGAYQSLLSVTGTDGVMGIGQLPQTSGGRFSPLVMLPAPLSDGYTIELSGSGGPSLLLGKPVKSASSVTVPLLGPRVPAGPFGGPQTPLRFPGGAPAYQGIFKLCWQVAGHGACGPTLADSGSPHGFIGTGLLPKLSQTGPLVAPGLHLSVSTPPPSNHVVLAYITALKPPDRSPAYEGAPLAQIASTGIGIYFSNTVGYDLADGQLIITPARAS